ncbi:protein required for ubiquinone biosynthesis and for respiratory growth [Tribonema minus]|uniref:Protein required for ubiquinone biosynthesis and for respiratory growth n=1 Tax=Tribonema minus TaxID=303371 RepID=A0A835YMK7_9STRA|nr:protein required for ubiquinone biosynthesis and for respiratory growth [Tribonema minus]
MASSRPGDLLRVLQGVGKVVAQLVETQAPAATERLSRLRQHGTDTTANVAQAANAALRQARGELGARLPRAASASGAEGGRAAHSGTTTTVPAAVAASQPKPTVAALNNLGEAQNMERQEQPPQATGVPLPIQMPVLSTPLKSEEQAAASATRAEAIRAMTPSPPKPEPPASDAADAAEAASAAATAAAAGLPSKAAAAAAAAAARQPPPRPQTPPASPGSSSSGDSAGGSARARRVRAVPSSPLARVLGFGQLAAGLAVGTVAEALRQGVGARGGGGGGGSGGGGARASVKQLMASDANAERLAEALCRMRGAALKLGQMLSIQDEGVIPPQLAKALERVRAGADTMPAKQLHAQLRAALGDGWRARLAEFDEAPLAAASIGQVHRAKLLDGTEVAMKIQYPGVADSIESDLSNLERLVTMTNLLPPGLFVEEIVEVAREELKLECDYTLEAANQERFRALVQQDPELSKHVSVPAVVHELVTPQVLTTHMVRGVHIDRVAALGQDARNAVARLLLRLTLRELFAWRFMQTDPNWGNYLYDADAATLHLIDFGACRAYDKRFVDAYLKLVWAAANGDADTLTRISRDLEFLTGAETPEMLAAHAGAGLVVGEPFARDAPFDFAASDLTARLGRHGEVFARHRLTPPPREAYSLHRKLAGAFLACIKLGAVINCRDILEETYRSYQFDDDASATAGLSGKAAATK